MNWKEVIGAVAPGLATALAGPLAGMAVSVIGQELLGKPFATVDEVSQAIVSGNPDTLAKLKQIDADFKAKMASLEIDLERLAVDDRKSARERESTTKDPTVKVLAYSYTFLYFLVLWGVWKYPIDPNVNDLLMILLGVLTAAQTQILNYYFGSSSGSSAKTAVLDRLVNHKT